MNSSIIQKKSSKNRKKSFGKLIKAARIIAGYDRIDDAAEEVGISGRRLYDFEKDNATPCRATMARIGVVYGDNRILDIYCSECPVYLARNEETTAATVA